MYLYIFQRTSYFNRTQCKIGISEDPERRLREVIRESGIRFKMILKKECETDDEATKIEKALLRKYKRKWRPPKKFAGSTELRVLEPEDISSIRVYLGESKAVFEAKTILIVALIISILIFLMKL